MKVQQGNGAGKKDRSLLFLHGEAASSSIESAGCAQQAPSVIATGGSTEGVALLAVLTNLVLAVLLIKVPSLMEGRHNSLKRTTILIALFSAFTWLPIVFVLSFMKSVSPLFLTGLWVFGLVPTVLLYPLRDNWLAGVVPGEKMGSYLGWRSAIAGAFYLMTYLAMGTVIDRTAVGGSFQGYGFILAIAFLASTLNIVFYCGVRQPPAPKVVETGPKLTFVSFLKSARKSHLGTFIVFISLYTFAVNLAGPLFASYMLGDLKFNMMTYTAIVGCEFVARIISLTFWGKYVDKVGSLRVLSIVAYAIPFVPILWIFSKSIVYLGAVQMLSGVVWSAFDLCVQTFVYKATQPEQRLRYIVYHRSLTSFSVAMGSLTGMFLLSHMFAINGSQILGMLLLSGVLRLVIARIMLPKLTPEGIPDAVVHPELAAELASPVVTPKIGLYYDPQAFRKFSRKAAGVGGNIIGAVGSKVNVTRKGLFYKPWKWGEYLDEKVARVTAQDTAAPVKQGLFDKPWKWGEYVDEKGARVTVENTAESAKQGLFSRPQEWADYQKELGLAEKAETAAVVKESLYHQPEHWAEFEREHGVRAEKSTAAPVKKEGLFHNPELWNQVKKQLGIADAVPEAASAVKQDGLYHQPDHWTEYLERSMVMNAITTPTGGEGMTSRQGIFGHPEMWDKYQKDTARIAAKKPAVLPATKSGLLHNPEEWERYKDTTSGRKPARPVVQPVRLALAAKSAAAFSKAPLTTKPTETRRAATTHVAAHPAPLTARKPRAVAVPA